MMESGGESRPTNTKGSFPFVASYGAVAFKSATQHGVKSLPQLWVDLGRRIRLIAKLINQSRGRLIIAQLKFVLDTVK